MKVKTKEEFVEDAIKVHGDKYNYTQTIYINSKTHVEVRCQIHGPFSVIPGNHITRGTGCPKCAHNAQKTRKTTPLELFKTQAARIHNNFYDYSRVVYVNAKTKVEIVCPKHGSFFKSPDNHINGTYQGCQMCSHEKKHDTTRLQSDFIRKAEAVFSGLYDYSQVKYVTAKTKVEIVCPEHGSFFQTPDNHIITKYGCPECARKNYTGGYSLEYFIRNPSVKDVPGLLYLIQLENNSEKFFKIGITNRNIKKRFAGYRYTVTPICSINTTMFSAFALEQQILDKYSGFRYYPNNRFKGWTECFSQKFPTEIVVSDFFR